MKSLDKRLRFNPTSPDFQKDPYSVYRHMRDHQPMMRIGRTWVITRHDDVHQALKNRDFISAGIPEHLHSEMQRQRLDFSPELQAIVYGIALFEDGAQHKQHRHALQMLFRGDFWTELNKIISDEAVALTEQIKNANGFDGVKQLAEPLWEKFFTRWLNLPKEQQAVVEQEKGAIRLLLDPSSLDSAGLERLLLALSNLNESFGALAQAHSAGHESLFYRALLKGYGDDKKTLHDRFPTDCITMLIGGSETSEALIGNLLLMLAQHPEWQASIKDGSIRLKDVINETVRFESPLQMARRKVNVPTEFLGRELRAGDNILLCLGSANRDESVFEDAYRFSPNKKRPQRSLGFGVGAHQCVGQILAHLQAEKVAQALCDEGAILMNGQETWSNRSLILRALDSLPIKMKTFKEGLK